MLIKGLSISLTTGKFWTICERKWKRTTASLAVSNRSKQLLKKPNNNRMA